MLARDQTTRLTVGAPPTACAHLIVPLIAEFEKANPRVHVHVVDTDLGNIDRLVQAGSIDIGLGMFVRPTGSIRTSLFKFTLVLASAAPRFQIGRTPKRWADLVDAPLIGLPADYPFQQIVAGHLAEAGRSQGPRDLVNFIDTQISMAAAGRGVAIIPTTAINSCRNWPVKLEPIVDPTVEMDYFELRDKARVLPPCADAFTSFLRESVPRLLAPFKTPRRASAS
ncbi:DNA-binding transcriptional activator GcvA [Pigmentiphaga humi]|uniref:DNA-binding transcriptional activator GcvA n=1 Tax=Pigmentiphaga humi TaxID=2478468 RepID=A0A3P4AWZ9_9BURK|nr:LysR substrate-binding domain-containing protein [Pigmentiphaga humi]VCU68041.1 DNA-binding transcriptional activator GcvA [Pigmentiphaga humi]